jgi:transcriptional regulator with XRE-family HTH domain
MRLTLTQARERKDWTPEQLAEKSGVSRATIYRLEGADAPNPEHQTIEKLEAALGVKPGTLTWRAA